MNGALAALLLAQAPVLGFHGDPARGGLYVDPAFRSASLKPAPGFDAPVEGPTYAQPLFLPRRNLLIVATEQDLVYALDPASGRVRWKRRLGTPVPLDRFHCGNIDPVGITGTPVASPDEGTVYVAAVVTPDGGRTKRHLVFALGTGDGATRAGWPVDVGARLGPRFDAPDQNQRSALALGKGTLIVVYGGHFGDCGSYRGWVVGLPLKAPEKVVAWSTPVRGGGLWAPGGPAITGGSLFAATGNTFGAEQFSYGESVLRFSLDPFRAELADWFAPSNWKELDGADRDLGGSGPLPFELGGRALVAAFGKDGDVYLLDRDHLGGIGGELARLHAVDNRGGLRGASAAFADSQGEVLLMNGRGARCPEGQSGDLAAVRVAAGSPPQLSVLWCANSHGHGPPGGSPMVTSPDGREGFVVWNVGAEGDDRLHAFDGETGKALYQSDPMHLVRRFQTPLAANGRIYVAADDRVYAFVPVAAGR